MPVIERTVDRVWKHSRRRKPGFTTRQVAEASGIDREIVLFHLRRLEKLGWLRYRGRDQGWEVVAQ